MSVRNLLLAALAVAGAPAVLAPVPAAAAHRLECQAPVDLVKLSRPLAKISARLLRNEDITILALGSSSTFGTCGYRPERGSRLIAPVHTRCWTSVRSRGLTTTSASAPFTIRYRPSTSK